MKKIILNKEDFERNFGDWFDFKRRIYEVMIPVIYENPLSILMSETKTVLKEGLIKTYPFDTVKRYICQYFNIPNYYFHEYDGNGNRCCAIDIPKGANPNLLKKAMNLCGYFMSTMTHLDKLDRYHFEPKFEKEDNYDGELLYHITKEISTPRIYKQGLCPSRKNNIYNFPSRVYFLKGNTTKEEVENIATVLKNAKGDGDEVMYVLLKIMVDKLPKGIKFHADPNLYNSIYTTDNVPPSAIWKEKTEYIETK